MTIRKGGCTQHRARSYTTLSPQLHNNEPIACFHLCVFSHTPPNPQLYNSKDCCCHKRFARYVVCACCDLFCHAVHVSPCTRHAYFPTWASIVSVAAPASYATMPMEHATQAKRCAAAQHVLDLYTHSTKGAQHCSKSDGRQMAWWREG